MTDNRVWRAIEERIAKRHFCCLQGQSCLEKMKAETILLRLTRSNPFHSLSPVFVFDIHFRSIRK